MTVTPLLPPLCGGQATTALSHRSASHLCAVIPARIRPIIDDRAVPPDPGPSLLVQSPTFDGACAPATHRGTGRRQDRFPEGA